MINALIYTVDTVSASYQQLLKEGHNVKEQSTEIEFTAQKVDLSLHDKQGSYVKLVQFNVNNRNVVSKF